MRRFLLDTGPGQDFNNDRNGIRQRADAESRKGLTWRSSNKLLR